MDANPDPFLPRMARMSTDGFNRLLKNYAGRRNTRFEPRARRSCRCNAQKALPGSSNAAPGPKRCCPLGCARKRFRGVSSGGDSLVEDCDLGCPRGTRRGHPFGTWPSASPSSRCRASSPSRAALRTALSDRNGGSAEFFNSLLTEIHRAFLAIYFERAACFVWRVFQASPNVCSD